MTWYWETYTNNRDHWAFIYDDGDFADEMGSVKRKRDGYTAYAGGKTRSFKYLTDAKRFVEIEERGRATTKKRSAGKRPGPFGL